MGPHARPCLRALTRSVRVFALRIALCMLAWCARACRDIAPAQSLSQSSGLRTGPMRLLASSKPSPHSVFSGLPVALRENDILALARVLRARWGNDVPVMPAGIEPHHGSFRAALLQQHGFGLKTKLQKVDVDVRLA